MAKQQMTAQQIAKIRENRQMIADTINTSSFKSRIGQMLPAHMTPDRFMRCVFLQLTKNPKLIECTPTSIERSVLQAGEVGLEPNGRDGHLVPYWNGKARCYEAQFIPDYKGLIQLAYQSTQVRSVRGQVVYERDEFDFAFGTEEFLKHKPYRGSGDRGQMIYAYAVAHLANGGAPFVVLTEHDIRRHMESSQSATSEWSPWAKHRESMWAKTGVRELSKWIPQSRSLITALANEDDPYRDPSKTIDASIITSIEPHQDDDAGGDDNNQPPRSDAEDFEAEERRRTEAERAQSSQAEELSKRIQQKREQPNLGM